MLQNDAYSAVIFVHVFALYVGVGVSKRIPISAEMAALRHLAHGRVGKHFRLSFRPAPPRCRRAGRNTSAAHTGTCTCQIKSERAKVAEKALCGETVVQKSVLESDPHDAFSAPLAHPH